MTHKKQGFTLVEIIITLVIVAILAAAIIPTYYGFRENSLQEKDKETAKAYSRSIMIDYMADDWEGVPSLSDAKQQISESVGETDGFLPEADGYYFWYNGETGEVTLEKASPGSDWARMDE